MVAGELLLDGTVGRVYVTIRIVLLFISGEPVARHLALLLV